jgi:hypothetical protein
MGAVFIMGTGGVEAGLARRLTLHSPTMRPMTSRMGRPMKRNIMSNPTPSIIGHVPVTN